MAAFSRLFFYIHQLSCSSFSHTFIQVPHCGRLICLPQQLQQLFGRVLSSACYTEGPLALVVGLSSWARRVWERTLTTPALSLLRFPVKAASWTCFMFSWTSALAFCSRSAWPWMLRRGGIKDGGRRERGMKEDKK